MNIRLTTATVLAAMTLGACVSHPRSPGDTNTFATGFAATAASGQDPQQDYSPASLLHEAHGDFFTGMQRFRPSAKARFKGMRSASLSGEPGQFDSWQVGGGGTVPIATDPDSMVKLGGFFEGRRFENEPGFPVGDKNLYEIGVHLGYSHFISDDTYVEGMFSPGVYSDLDGNLTHDDWKWHGHLLATHRSRDDLYFKLGLESSHVFKDTSLYPVAGLAWIIEPNWRLDVLAPREIELSYLMDSATTLSLGLALDGQRYRVRSSLATGKIESDYITQELNLYLGGIHRVDDHLSLFGRIGAAVSGRYEFRTVDSGGSPTNIEGHLEPTIMFEIGLGWEF